MVMTVMMFLTALVYFLIKGEQHPSSLITGAAFLIITVITYRGSKRTGLNNC
jgi:hypothetical protein